MSKITIALMSVAVLATLAPAAQPKPRKESIKLHVFHLGKPRASTWTSARPPVPAPRRTNPPAKPIKSTVYSTKNPKRG